MRVLILAVAVMSFLAFSKPVFASKGEPRGDPIHDHDKSPAGGQKPSGGKQGTGGNQGGKPENPKPDKPDLSLPQGFGEGRSNRPEKQNGEKKDGKSVVHSEGGGWGSISTGRNIEPSGYYKDGAVGMGVTIHFCPTAEPTKHRYRHIPKL